jgi:sigma-B regulation protein RsbU (phosphoserine phosphatase)
VLPRARNPILYAVLLALFALAATYQTAYSIALIERLPHSSRNVAWPFHLNIGSDRIGTVQDNAVGAGLRAGDRLLTIEGEPYRGEARLMRILRAKKPGDSVAVRVRHADGAEAAASIALSPANPVNLKQWLTSVATEIVTPTFCLLLGFAVAFIRPRDPLAWLLLALMISFGRLSAGDATVGILWSWPSWARVPGIFLTILFGVCWALCMFLFGLYFPDRSRLDRRFPWLKWLLIAPLALDALSYATLVVGDAENFASVAWLERALNTLGNGPIFLRMIAIGSFFALLWTKLGRERSADAKRRLSLLVWGASAALTPLFFLALWGIAKGWNTVPDVVLIPCYLLLAIFPLTLAYVIVVHRALDVRVVIRQGLQYGLASRGLRVLQALAILVVMTTAATLASDPARNRPRKITAIAVGLNFAILIGLGGERLRRSIDRRFFREAYHAEQVLSELSDKVGGIVETGPLLETVARQISGSLHVGRIAALIKSDGHFESAYALGYSDTPPARFEEHGVTLDRLRRNREPLRVYFDDPDSWMYGEPLMGAPERDQLRALDSQLLLPLTAKDKLMGFLSLGPKRSEEPYSKSDVQLLQSVAAQTGMALENSRLTAVVASEVAQRERLNRELEIAREVQERLFPQTCPAVPGLDYAGYCRPALGVGGDYYDFLELPAGRFGFAIGDVSGKGIPAALLMACLQASLRGQTIGGSTDLACLMSDLNRLIYNATPANRYATFFYAQYEPATRTLAYVNGGHNPPMLLRGSEVIRLEEGGPVIGLFKPSKYSQASIALEPGDVLTLFTDGISESMNAADDEWGEDNLLEAIRRCRRLCAGDMLVELMREADAFAAGAPQHDDMTVMVFKLRA